MTNERAQTELPSLKPCPCCGSVARLMPMSAWSKFKATCRNIDCQLQTPLLSEEEAATRWNQRA